MEEKITKMIATIKSEFYDQEIMHSEYEHLLEEFILNFDESLIGLMKELISLEKDFWYA